MSLLLSLTNIQDTINLTSKALPKDKLQIVNRVLRTLLNTASILLYYTDNLFLSDDFKCRKDLLFKTFVNLFYILSHEYTWENLHLLFIITQ